MKEITLYGKTGAFAENKDAARDVRINEIVPVLKQGNDVILNFENIETATQSFIHALISDLFRQFGNNVLDKIQFKSCSENVRDMVSIVTNYMQERDQ